MTIIGVGGGFIGIGILIWQAILTRKSADAAKETADTAKRSVDNIVNSERAWVTVSIENHFRTEGHHSGLYDVILANYGSTPARIVEARGDLHLFEKGASLPDGPSYQTDILPAKKLLAPEEEWGIRTFGIHATVEYVAGGTKSTNQEQFYIGYVAYRHIFDSEGSPPHYTRFCFRLQANWTWQAFGSSAYHEYS